MRILSLVEQGNSSIRDIAEKFKRLVLKYNILYIDTSKNILFINILNPYLRKLLILISLPIKF